MQLTDKSYQYIGGLIHENMFFLVREGSMVVGMGQIKGKSGTPPQD